MLWSNTVLAAGNAVGFIVYTGAETRAVMNTSHPETKVGLLDLEINKLAKVCTDVLKQGGILIYALSDSLCRNIRPVLGSGRTQRIQGLLVHLYLPFLDSLLVYHSHQVCFPQRVLCHDLRLLLVCVSI